jgi:four helix bundle protein
MIRRFDDEKFGAYQRSLDFIRWLEPLLHKLPKSVAVREQLDPASTSIPLNLTEGNGKFTSADRCRFFDNGIQTIGCTKQQGIKIKIKET